MKNLTNYILEKLSINNDVKDIKEVCKENFEKIVKGLNDKGIRTIGRFDDRMGTYDMQFIRVSYLKEEDEPDIADNGSYLSFRIWLKSNTIELKDTGHIYLTKADQKASYLAMTGVKGIFKHAGKPFFRKTRFKTSEECIKKIENFYNETKKLFEKYTEGYPYHQMKLNIYASNDDES